MGIFGRKTPVATLEVALFDDTAARVTLWTEAGERQETGYHAVLLFLMYYARILFFLSFRDTAQELVDRMIEAVGTLASTGPDERVSLAEGWSTDADTTTAPRTMWSAALSSLGPGEYRCKDQRPEDPSDADAQMVVLLSLQYLANTLPAVERAYLALGIAGMHEYYETGLHWHTSKSLHPAPAFGMAYARRVLEGRSDYKGA